MTLDYKLFDGWINMVPKNPDYGNMDVTYLFPALAERYENGRTTEQIVDEMDEAGIDQAVLAAGYDKHFDDTKWTLESMERYPDRFHGSWVVDPHRGMADVRELESRVRNDGFKMARIMAFHTLIPYTDPRCYSLYAKCVELDSDLDQRRNPRAARAGRSAPGSHLSGRDLRLLPRPQGHHGARWRAVGGAVR